jgi:tRNA modification GTPase
MQEGLHKIVSSEETIVAISTPLGLSGLGVLRMSGSQVLAIGRRFFEAHSKLVEFDHRKAIVGRWIDGRGEEIDEVVVTFFRAPHSYTGEDVLEISAHGNPIILSQILESARTAGARIAAPGEFTLRAVANGKMDLIQAEAVREFIESQTEQQARMALRQIEGSLSKRIRPAKAKLIDVIAHLEAGIDFAEDDVDVPANTLVLERLRPVAQELDALCETFGFGKILSKGLRLAILGKPNVGKSSLFNRLVACERAIVTDIPGTTRDVLKETIDIDGVPLCLADTAGVRETSDHVETIGVARAFETLSEADLGLVVLDGSVPMDDDDRMVLQKAAWIPHIVVINKSDLRPRIDAASLNGARRVQVSAKTGDGLPDLLEALRSFLLSSKTHLADDLVLTNERQYEAILKSTAALKAASDALRTNVPHEMVLLDLYRALSALDELTGEVVTDDILERIFSTFCIGK